MEYSLLAFMIESIAFWTREASSAYRLTERSTRLVRRKVEDLISHILRL